MKSKEKTTPISLTANESVVANKRSSTEMSNNFFVNFGPNLASKIPKAKKAFNACLRKSVENWFFYNPIQECEMEKIINKVSQNKSLGACSITSKY